MLATREDEVWYSVPYVAKFRQVEIILNIYVEHTKWTMKVFVSSHRDSNIEPEGENKAEEVKM